MTTSKQIEATCSICKQPQNVSLLGCCLIFNCQNCLNRHQCEAEFSIIPLSVRASTQTIQSKCGRCSRIATLKCQSCKGKLFCESCSNHIHRSKYSLHYVSELLEKQVPASARSARSPIKKRISIACDESRLSQYSQSKQNCAHSFYMLETIEVKLQTKISELNYFKQITMQKWEHIQSLVAINFGNLRTQLAIKQNEILALVDQAFKQQIQMVGKLTQDLLISKNAFESLIRLSDRDPTLNHLSKSKKTSILQDIKRIEKKLEACNYVEYKYSQQAVNQIANNIGNLKPFQKIKLPTTIRVIDSTSTLNDKSSKSIRLSSKSISKKQLTCLLKKNPPPATSITGSRKSILESPKGSVNSSINSTTKFIKKKQNNATFENEIDRLLNDGKIKKREGLNNSFKFNSFFDSPKVNKVRESRSKSKLTLNASFAAASPQKYQKYQIWKR